MDETPPASVVQKYVEYINAGDLEGLASLTADEYKFTDTGGDVEIVSDKESVRRFWEGYFTPYPDFKIIVHHVLVGGDGVAIVGKTTASHIPPEVEERETLLWTAEVSEGLVSEWRIYSDEEEVRKSLND